MSDPELAAATMFGQESIMLKQPCCNTRNVTNSQGQLNLNEPHPKNATPAPEQKSLSFKLAFLGLAMVLIVFQLDATCLSIALPAISGDLQGTSLQSFWANLGYSLCGLVSQPVWASISGIFGRKHPLHASVCLFFVGSIIFATAQNMKTIIVGRILQGLGGGGIDVLVSIILADMTTLHERSKYLGFMAIPSAIGTIMGPFVGAFFSTYLSWRWIGWINLPLLGLGGLLVLFFLKLRTISQEATLSSQVRLVDWTGMVLLIAGITALCVPVSWAGSLFPWSSWQTLLPLILGFAFLAFFSWYESKPAAPIVPYQLFQTKTGNAALIGGFIHGMILNPLLQYLPLLYQAVLLRTAISSAVYLLPTVIMSALVTAAAMMLVPVLGGYVMLIRTGWCIAILGIGLMTVLDIHSSESMLYGLPILWGQGVSVLRILMLPIQASVKDINDEGLATANFLTIRMFGALLGLAVCSPIFTHVFSSAISNVSFDLNGSLAPLKDARNAVNFIGNLRTLKGGSAMFDEVLQVYLVSFRTIFYIMAVLSGLGLVSSMFLDEIALKRDERGVQSFEDS